MTSIGFENNPEFKIPHLFGENKILYQLLDLNDEDQYFFSIDDNNVRSYPTIDSLLTYLIEQDNGNSVKFAIFQGKGYIFHKIKNKLMAISILSALSARCEENLVCFFTEINTFTPRVLEQFIQKLDKLIDSLVVKK